MASATEPVKDAPDTGGLWQNQDFARLWIGQSLSQIGTNITFVAIPVVAVVTLQASSTEMGVMGALIRLPMLAFLFFGVLADRVRKRPVLIWSDLGRAAVLLLVPVLYLTDTLTLIALYAVVFVLSLLSVMFQVAYRTYFPHLVRPEHLGEGNSRLQLTESLAQTVGPGLAAGLLKVMAAPLLLFIDAFTYLFSAAACYLIRKPEDKPATDETAGGVHRAIWEGLRWLMGQPLLRPLAIASAMHSLFIMGAMESMYVLFVLEGGPDIGAEWIGLVMAAGGVGATIGALVSVRVMKRLGLGPALLMTTAVGNAALLLIPLAVRPLWLAVTMLAVSQLIVWMNNQIFFVNNMTLVQSVTPPHLQGRIIATIYALGLIPAPLGALVSGLLGDLIGLRPTILMAVLIGGLGPFLLLLFSAVPKVKDFPPPPSAPGDAPDAPTPDAPAPDAPGSDADDAVPDAPAPKGAG